LFCWLLCSFFYAKQAFPVIAYGILFSGILTWLIGRSSYHIGASGLVYVLVSFIFVKGILTILSVGCIIASRDNAAVGFFGMRFQSR
jgi:xanthine/uracil permease